jgi:squalene-hopene/tetraprenyl-beta-curcumene cyclase
VIALRESGLPADHPALQSAASWLLKQEIRQEGDWVAKNPHARPGCWAFEFVNRIYPDLDDTAVVPRALMRVRLNGQEERD